MAFDTSYDVIYRNLYWADTLYYADTTAFPEGVRLIQVSLWNRCAKPPKSTAGSHEEDGTERRCFYTVLSGSKRGPDSFSFFFFGFGAIGNQKKASPDPFHENMVRKVYTAKISGPYQLFCGFGPIFSVV